LMYFAINDGDWNRNVPIIMVCIDFLGQATGAPMHQHALINLKTRLQKNPTEADLKAWATGAFPRR